jgi:hypothetical protein
MTEWKDVPRVNASALTNRPADVAA